MTRSPPDTALRSFEPTTAPGPDEVPCLEVMSGASKGRVVPLRLRSMLLGRASTAQLMLDEDGVSRNHAKIVFYDDGRPQLVDLESTNGTFVNGRRVDVCALTDGDRLQLGPSAVLRLLYLDRAAVDEHERASARLPTEPLPLSPRELEVAELVVEGLTNPDIATELHISLRTVTTHLGNIYRRLDINSRAALTRVMMEHRLSR